MTVLTMKTLLNVKPLWGVATLCCSLCSTPALAMPRNSHLNVADLVVTSVNPTSAPEAVVWCSDPSNVIKELPTVGLPGDYFYSPMLLQGDWNPYTETICSVDPSGRGSDETAATYISQHNGFLYLHEMRAYRDDTQTIRYWTF